MFIFQDILKIKVGLTELECLWEPGLKEEEMNNGDIFQGIIFLVIQIMIQIQIQIQDQITIQIKMKIDLIKIDI